MTSMNPLIFPLMYIIILQMVLSNIKGIDPNIRKVIINNVFPFLEVFGMTLSAGLYSWTITTDREDKLRYLLNFAGMRSSAYMVGFLFSDLIIYLIP